MFQILPPMTAMLGNGTGQTCRPKAESLVNAPAAASRSFRPRGNLWRLVLPNRLLKKASFQQPCGAPSYSKIGYAAAYMR
jgi:hypothetical protein